VTSGRFFLTTVGTVESVLFNRPYGTKSMQH
jgi:hypothetical protein